MVIIKHDSHNGDNRKAQFFQTKDRAHYFAKEYLRNIAHRVMGSYASDFIKEVKGGFEHVFNPGDDPYSRCASFNPNKDEYELIDVDNETHDGLYQDYCVIKVVEVTDKMIDLLN